MSAGDLFIVDDNANNLGLLSTILRDAGYAVRMANSGRRALAAVASQLALARLRGTLEERNRELAGRNAELLAAQRYAEQIFATLAAVLPGSVLDDKYKVGAQLGAGG